MTNKEIPWGEIGYIVYKRCVEKNTLVLTQDLNWKKAGDLVVGEGIIGFDENRISETRMNSRYLRKGVVTHNEIEKANCYGIELETGEIIYATKDHSWLVKMSNSEFEWRETQYLNKTKKNTPIYLPRTFGKPWEKDDSYEAGYIAAAFDGEGSLDKTSSMMFTQTENTMLSRMENYLNIKDIDFVKKLKNGISTKQYKKERQPCYDLKFYGIKNIIRTLGIFDMTRLKAKFLRNLENINKNRKGQILRCNPEDYVKVIRVFDAGEMEIAVLSTSIKTHFTGGFPSHNTYSRSIGNEKTEEFDNTIDRVLEACQKQLKVGFNNDELDDLKSMFLGLKGSVAGRFLWQLGTKTVNKLGLPSLQNCFTRDTTFVTSNGIKSFADFEDNEDVVIKGNLSWKPAKVKYFGKQDIVELVVQRKSCQEVIKVTKNHRWNIANRYNKHESIKTTEQLKKGDILQRTGQKTNLHNLKMCNIGIQHGLVFGDGNYNSNAKCCAFTPCGDSSDEYRKFFNDKGNTKEITGLPYNWKSIPSFDYNKHYLYGFLAGYFAADGSVDKHGTLTISNKSKHTLHLIKGLFTKLDVYCGNPTLSREINPFNGEPAELWKLTIHRDNLSSDFLILDKHKQRWSNYTENNQWKVVSVSDVVSNEDVWCVVEPENEEFTLANGILTKNCAATLVNEPIRPFTWAFEMLMLGCGVGFNIQREYVYQIPKVKRKLTIERHDDSDADFIVPDTREGWVSLLEKVLTAHFITGKGFTYSVQLIRSKGAPISGFGGVASGPEELCKGIAEISNLLNSRSGKKVQPIDCLDIMNIIASIVVSGNVN